MFLWIPVLCGSVVFLLASPLGRRVLLEHPGPVARWAFATLLALAFGYVLDGIAQTSWLQYVMPLWVGLMAASGYPEK